MLTNHQSPHFSALMALTETATTPATTPATPPAPADLLRGWDHLELWVGNARAVTHFLTAGFGFECVAYAGPETGQRDRASYLLQQGRIRLVVTAGLGSDTADSPIAAHVQRHGDGVRTVAFAVTDVDAAFDAATARGAAPVTPPAADTDEHGTVRSATIAVYGETRHAFIDRSRYTGPFAPGFSRTTDLPQPQAERPVGLDHFDHVVGNVEEGRLDQWVEWYETVLGFTQMKHFDADQISTEFSALRSTVVWNGRDVTMPINEPAPGRKKSQIQEYLDSYAGPGVQHIALATPDIVTAVAELKRRGIRFLVPPEAYYEDTRVRCGEFDLPWDELARLGILVDKDGGGYLLQVFTETLGDRPTLFLEIIQREGATGFGEGNFKALFEAMEREQARRGNL
jgi:4-hydroxyphenylpyruvate dioxygenase